MFAATDPYAHTGWKFLFMLAGQLLSIVVAQLEAAASPLFGWLYVRPLAHLRLFFADPTPDLNVPVHFD